MNSKTATQGILLLTLVTLVLACGRRESRYEKPNSNHFQPPSNTLVGFARSIITENSQFSAYIPKAGRLSLIDPVTLNERWGTQVGNHFIDAVPLANFDGIALASSTEVRVYSGKDYRSFPLKDFSDQSSWAVSQDSPTMAFTSQSGKSISLVKHLSGIEWQEANLTVPEDSKTQVVGTMISKSGNLIMVVASPPGSYSIYRSPDRKSAFNTTPISCEAPSSTDTSTSVYSAGLIDEENQIAILADGNKSLYFVKIDDQSSCSDPVNWNKLGTSANVNYLTQLASGKLIAALDNGSFSVISVSNAAGTLEANFQTPCSSAIGSAEGKDGLLFIRCAGEVHSYKQSDAAGYELIKSHTFNAKHALTPAFDPTNSSAYYLDNGGLGTVYAINLVTGERRSKSGLFVKDIFSKK